MLSISNSAYYLPKNIGTVEYWCELQHCENERRISLLENGASHYRYALNESLLDMGKEALYYLMSQINLLPENIDVVIYFHTSQVNILPPPLSTIKRLCHEVKIKNIPIFSIAQQNCVSSLYAMKVVESLFYSNKNWQNALLIGIDSIMDESLRAIGVSGIHSDGSSATLLTRDKIGAKLIALETYNDLKLYKGIDESGNYEEDNNYLWSAISLIKKTLKSANIKAEQLESILPHNVNFPGWQHILRSLKVSSDKLFSENIKRVGHVFGNDFAINMVDSNALKTKGKHLIFSSGIGGCFGCAVIQCD